MPSDKDSTRNFSTSGVLLPDSSVTRARSVGRKMMENDGKSWKMMENDGNT